jgi:hypothetical protein
MAVTRQQMIFGLKQCSWATEDRIDNRLRHCNVRIVREDGSSEPTWDIRTRLQLIAALQDDPTMKCVQYYFNQKWTTAQA